jgi:hypothetical protein
MDSSSLEKKRSRDQFQDEHAHGKVGVFDEESTDWDAAFSKRTLRKVDFRVLPILAAVYSLSMCVSVFDVDFLTDFLFSIDRTNTSNAYVAGTC